MVQDLTRICFIRHGETDWNVQLRMQGHIDQPLNANGEAQAIAVGRYFSGLSVAALYSSDLQRAWQTAQPIGQALDLPTIRLPALRERNYGRCEGLTLEEVSVQFAEDARAIRRRDPDYPLPGGGESRRQHQMRILECVDRLLRDHAGQTLVVVTHGGVLDVVYRRVHGLPPETPRNYRMPNAGINWVSIAGDHWSIECWGETAHLG